MQMKIVSGTRPATYEMPKGCGKDLANIPCYSLNFPGEYLDHPSGVNWFGEGHEAAWKSCGNTYWDGNKWRAYCESCMRKAGWLW